MLSCKWVKEPCGVKGNDSRNGLGEQKNLQSLTLQKKNFVKCKTASWLEKPPMALLGDPPDYCH